MAERGDGVCIRISACVRVICERVCVWRVRTFKIMLARVACRCWRGARFESVPNVRGVVLSARTLAKRKARVRAPEFGATMYSTLSDLRRSACANANKRSRCVRVHVCLCVCSRKRGVVVVAAREWELRCYFFVVFRKIFVRAGVAHSHYMYAVAHKKVNRYFTVSELVLKYECLCPER